MELIDDNDVIKFSSEERPTEDATTTVREAIEAIYESLDGSYKWSNDDVQYLSVNGGGWKKGKLEICLRFIPSEEETDNSY